MATVTGYLPFKTQNMGTFSGEVIEATTSKIVISDGVNKYEITGTFEYTGEGRPVGQFTGFAQYNSDQKVLEITDIGFRVMDYLVDEAIIMGSFEKLIQVALFGPDVIHGSDYSDIISGRADADVIYANGGDDRISAYNGFDYIDGGDGFDTVVFSGPLQDYDIIQFAGQTYVTGLNNDAFFDRQNTLVNVEALSFADGVIAPPTQEFQPLAYIASYTDLVEALGTDIKLGLDHYTSTGVFEGRQSTFNGLEYIASNSDLMTALNVSADVGARHFIVHGMSEGRKVDFDGLTYIASNGDLINAFGADADSGTNHYITYGFSEGRSKDDFNVAQYLANYSDLSAAFGSDLDAATQHYVVFGYQEGRHDDFFF